MQLLSFCWGCNRQIQSTASSIKFCVQLLSFCWGSHIKLKALHFPSSLVCGCCPFVGVPTSNSKHCIFHQVLCAAVVLLLGFPHQTQSTAFSIKSCVRLLSFHWGSHIKLGALHFPSGLACGWCPFVGAPVNKLKALHFPSSLLCGWCPFVCGEGVVVACAPFLLMCVCVCVVTVAACQSVCSGDCLTLVSAPCGSLCRESWWLHKTHLVQT